MESMTTDEHRSRIDEAWQRWRDAEEAYHDESGRYIAMWWEGQPVVGPEKVVTHEALELLARLRAEAEAAQDAYTRAAASGRS